MGLHDGLSHNHNKKHLPDRRTTYLVPMRCLSTPHSFSSAPYSRNRRAWWLWVTCRMYSDDSKDELPKATKHVYFGYKELMKSYVALRGIASAQDKLFACPADVFYYDYVIGHHAGPLVGYVPESLCAQSSTDYSSYAFNGGNLLGMTNIVRPGIAGQALSSIRHPARAVLVAEIPALIPFSWHKPKRPLYF